MNTAHLTADEQDAIDGLLQLQNQPVIPNTPLQPISNVEYMRPLTGNLDTTEKTQKKLSYAESGGKRKKSKRKKPKRKSKRR